MYNRNIKVLDEPHSPVHLDKMLSNGNVNKGKFANENYSFSYLEQVKVMSSLNVSSILEIGPGDDLSSIYFRGLGITFDTMNIPQSHTNSKYLCRLEDFDETEISKKYELVAAFQMLEHSPYESFASNILKMSRITSKYIFISLPYDCYGFDFMLTYGFSQKSKKTKLGFWIPSFRPNRRYRSEYMKEFPWAVHYWEIGRRSFPLKKIITDIEKSGLKVIKKYHGINPYHFFILAEKY